MKIGSREKAFKPDSDYFHLIFWLPRCLCVYRNTEDGDELGISMRLVGEIGSG